MWVGAIITDGRPIKQHIVQDVVSKIVGTYSISHLLNKHNLVTV